jgi:hypothetical protein
MNKVQVVRLIATDKLTCNQYVRYVRNITGDEPTVGRCVLNGKAVYEVEAKDTRKSLDYHCAVVRLLNEGYRVNQLTEDAIARQLRKMKKDVAV